MNRLLMEKRFGIWTNCFYFCFLTIFESIIFVMSEQYLIYVALGSKRGQIARDSLRMVGSALFGAVPLPIRQGLKGVFTIYCIPQTPTHPICINEQIKENIGDLDLYRT